MADSTLSASSSSSGPAGKVGLEDVKLVVKPEDFAKAKDWWRCRHPTCERYIYSEDHDDSCPFRHVIPPDREDSDTFDYAPVIPELPEGVQLSDVDDEGDESEEEEEEEELEKAVHEEIPGAEDATEERPEDSERIEEQRAEKRNALPSGWEEFVDQATGVPYYYNEKTGTTQWERPSTSSEVAEEGTGVTSKGTDEGGSQASTVEAVYDKLNKILGKTKDTAKQPEQSKEAAAAVPTTSSNHPVQSSGSWQAVWAPSYGAYYYFNRITGITTWERPPDYVETPDGAAAPESAPESSDNVVEFLKAQAQQTVPELAFDPLQAARDARKPYDRAEKQMSAYFDTSKLDENRAQAMKLKKKLAETVDWKEYKKQKKEDRKKAAMEWLIKD